MVILYGPNHLSRSFSLFSHLSKRYKYFHFIPYLVFTLPVFCVIDFFILCLFCVFSTASAFINRAFSLSLLNFVFSSLSNSVASSGRVGLLAHINSNGVNCVVSCFPRCRRTSRRVDMSTSLFTRCCSIAKAYRLVFYLTFSLGLCRTGDMPS